MSAGTADAVATALAVKGERRISVCLPCRNEEATVGRVVDALVGGGSGTGAGLIDELVVLDDRSTDRSVERALAAGAKVVSIDEVHTVYGGGTGKGNVLWCSLWCTTGDIVVWIDADVVTAEADWVAKLALPLLTDDAVGLVKATYHRPRDEGGGGRTTELVVRPLLSLLAPEMGWLQQPLGGEVAVRRTMVEQLPFVQGWGVEIAMLFDTVNRFGREAVAEVDLGERRHRHHDLMDLRPQAAEVAATLLQRCGVQLAEAEPMLHLPDAADVSLNLAERPPVREVRRHS